MTDNFLHYRSHLIYLNRVNNEVLSLIAIFFRSLCKAIGDFLNPVVQNIRKTYQHRSGYVPQLQFVYQFLQIDGYSVFSWSYYHMTFVIDTKV